MILIFGGTASPCPSSAVARWGRLSSARCEIPGRLVFEADDTLHLLEQLKDANQPEVLDGQVESEGERWALRPEALGCGSDDDTESVGGGRFDERDDDDGESEEAVRPASIPTLSFALKPSGALVPSAKTTVTLAQPISSDLSHSSPRSPTSYTGTGSSTDSRHRQQRRSNTLPSSKQNIRRSLHQPRRRPVRCERRGCRPRRGNEGFARGVLLRLAARAARDLRLRARERRGVGSDFSRGFHGVYPELVY